MRYKNYALKFESVKVEKVNLSAVYDSSRTKTTFIISPGKSSNNSKGNQNKQHSKPIANYYEIQLEIIYIYTEKSGNIHS